MGLKAAAAAESQWLCGLRDLFRECGASQAVLVEVGANTAGYGMFRPGGRVEGHLNKAHIRLCASARAQGKKIRLMWESTKVKDKRIHEMLQPSSHLKNSNMASTLHSEDTVEVPWLCLSPPIERIQ